MNYQQEIVGGYFMARSVNMNKYMTKLNLDVNEYVK